MKYINFTSNYKVATFISTILVALSLLSIYTKGFNFSIDFLGGTVIEVKGQRIDIDKSLSFLPKNEYIIQTKGDNTFSIKMESNSDSINTKILDNFKKNHLTVISSSSIGSSIGQELLSTTILALLLSFVVIIVYVAIRFEYKFALGSVVALFHDVIIVAGLFSYFQIKFDVATFAAFLAIIGYSINDTIVIFDRIRETNRKLPSLSASEVINISVTNTLSRTLITSGTTLLTVLSVLVFGGDSLRGFSIALSVGIIVGTYSSIYIATSFIFFNGIDTRVIVNDDDKIVI